MINQLVGSVYSALDRDPNGQIVLRARHADGFAWSVAWRVLTVSTESGEPLLEFSLRDKTLNDVRLALLGAGCSIVYANVDFLPLAADTLLDGAGRQSESNGDSLRAYDSMLWSLLDAHAIALEDMNHDFDAALRQLRIGTAEDEWLDVWGEYFGLPREPGEQDDRYSVRIVVETLRPRVNRYAIEKAVKDITGKTIELYEPWRDLFVLGQSALDGKDHMRDGQFYTRNVIQPRSNESIDWTRVLQIVNRNRAAGTIVAPPRFASSSGVTADISATGSVKAGMEELRSLSMFVQPENRLDVFRLGMSGPQRKNHKLIMSELIALRNRDPLATPGSINAARRNMRRANIVLSDSDPIGSLNAVFQRTYWIQPPEVMRLGVTKLSDYKGKIELGMVDEIRTLYAGGVSFSDFGGAVASFGITETRSIGAVDAAVSQAQIPGGREDRKSETDNLSGVLNPSVRMWGFSGAGAWNQDASTNWQEGTPWGDGIRQS